jgi:FAD/FMN-containing dehydrogenase
VSEPYDIDALKRRLRGIKVEDHAVIVKQKSRDFFWYSPILKQQLENVAAQAIVSVRSEADIVETLAAAYHLNIPVTARGSGTGNYGQAMPLAGGLVIDLSEMNAVRSVARGSVICEPGAIMARIDEVTRIDSQQELRMHPSTYSTASIGGFVAGGSGGVGSINWGGLRDFGNVLRLRIVTMEAAPKFLELRGENIHKVIHAYGTNGLISEVEMALDASYPWNDVIVGFDSFSQAALFANALGEQDGILTKLITVIAAPTPYDIFLRHRRYLAREKSVVIIMVAGHSRDAFDVFTRRSAGAELLYDSQRLTDSERRALPPGFELTWNHTTLRAIRVDPTMTYLQVLYPFPNQLALVERIHRHFGEEVLGHLEFVRFNGNITCFGLPLVRFTTPARLDEIVRQHEMMGAPIFNPHRYTLEEGGMKQTDSVQLEFKRQADPSGLLNPGKMIAWEDPNFDFSSSKTYLFPTLAGMS